METNKDQKRFRFRCSFWGMFTDRKGRQYFHKRLPFCSGGWGWGVYEITSCLWSYGPSQRGCLPSWRVWSVSWSILGVWSNPGECKADSLGVGTPPIGRHPLVVRHPPEIGIPLVDRHPPFCCGIHCSGRCASCWNTFLSYIKLTPAVTQTIRSVFQSVSVLFFNRYEHAGYSDERL